jgi:ribosomal protein S18 acetylase RimI-like enzyme
VIIEKALPEDATAISRLIALDFPYTKATSENVKARMQKPNIRLFKAVEKSEIAGFVELEFLDNLFGVWRINGLAVKKSERKKGFGKKLVEFTLEFLKKQGALKIALLVRPDNYVAKKMYRKFGFESNGFWKSQINGKKTEEWVLELEEGRIA